MANADIIEDMLNVQGVLFVQGIQMQAHFVTLDKNQQSA